MIPNKPVVILIGSTGSGKSSTCNTLGGCNFFKVSSNLSSETYKTF